MFAYPVGAPRAATTLSSALALATALAAGPALAQSVPSPSYNAPDPTVVSGSVTFDRGVTTAGRDVYTIATPTAVLDFTPNDTATGGGPINFQNAGTTAVFQNNAANPNFTVLNRIVPADPTRPIIFNGATVSQLVGATVTRGGTVWFYSPGGIIVGPTGTFDIGNLLLSTGDPTGGTGTISSTSTFTLNSVADSGAAVSVQAGGAITAPNPGSYIALVAPVVSQAGTVNINGGAAYVAAEQATLTVNQGLFDITVTTGSSSAGGFPLTHTGSTLFTDTAVAQRAYLVAVPKNSAITLLIASSGTLGFTTATAANLDQGAIVLSAGYNVAEASGTRSVSGPVHGAQAADLQVNSGTFNADVDSIGARDALVITNVASSFARDISLRGTRTVQLAGNGAALTVGRDANVYADAITSGGAAVAGSAQINAFAGGTTTIGRNALISAVATDLTSGTAQGGAAQINSFQGNVSVGGDLTIQADATAGQNVTASTPGIAAGSATAGTADLFSNNVLTIGGNVTLTARGQGGASSTGGSAGGGAGTGGRASFGTNGTVTIGGNVAIGAEGYGGGMFGTTGTGNGGTATAGAALLSVNGGSLTIGGTVGVFASAFGGSPDTAASGGGGAATSGDARIVAQNGSTLTIGTVTAPTTVTVRSNATAGTTLGAGGATVANATGTTASISQGSGGRVTINGAVTINSNAVGAAAGTGGATTGGTGTGGDVRFVSNDGTLSATGSVTLTANGNGGLTSATGGTGGAGRGGLTNIGSAAQLTQVGGIASLTAQGTGGAATASSGANGIGGAGTGGQALIGGTGAGTLSLLAAASLSAPGIGGASNGGGTGGLGTGGTAQLFAQRGVTSAASSASVAALGTGGSGARAGAGQGGQASIAADGGQVRIAGAGSIFATGLAGIPSNANGGATGTGGNSSFFTFVGSGGGGGSVTVNGAALASAAGFGFNNPNIDPIGGAARGGNANVTANGGALTFNGTLDLNAAARGGYATTRALGAATGGTAAIAADGGSVTILGNVTAVTPAIGAFSSTPSGLTGGNATGGSSFTRVGAGFTLDMRANVTLNAPAFGGTAFNGSEGQAGNAAGGNATLNAQGTLRVGGAFSADATATGGGNTQAATGNGGAATGGTAQAFATGTMTIAGGVTLRADANGGSGPTTGMGNGGDATGGTAQITLGTGGSARVTGASLIEANGTGGTSGLIGGGGGAGTGGNAVLRANGGTVTVDSNTLLLANGTGGAGAFFGGNGTGGGAEVSAINGTLDATAGTSTLEANAEGTGGDATVVYIPNLPQTPGNILIGSGFGGTGTGGQVTLSGDTLATGTATTIGGVLLNAVEIEASGEGGNGAAGRIGQPGGRGGDGMGGTLFVGAQAGNGRIVVGDVDATAEGSGGRGGDGGAADLNGTLGPAADGGRGGDALAGGLNFGTVSNPATSFTAGSASIGNVVFDATAGGGDGGAATGAGAAGGVGGDATGGSGFALSRGSLASFGDITITAVGSGGDGGADTSGLASGGGTGGGGVASIASTVRFQATARGSLIAGDFLGIAGGIGGAGPNGAPGASVAGLTAVTVTTADAHIASVTERQFGDTPATPDPNFRALSVSGGTLTVDGNIDIQTVGTLQFYVLAGGVVNAPNLILSATNTVDFGDATTNPTPGDTNIDDSVTITVGGDLIYTADIGQDDDPADILQNLTVNAGGAITLANVRVGQALDLSAGGNVTSGNLEAVAGSVDVASGGAMALGNVRAGNSITLASDGALSAGNLTALTNASATGATGEASVAANGDITLGDVTALDIDIDGTDLSDGPFGNIVTGNLAGEFIEVRSGGSARIGAVTTGDLFGGASAVTANPFAAELGAAGDLTVGAITSAGLVALASQTGSVATRAISTPASVVALAGTSIMLGGAGTTDGVRTGRGANDSLFLANSSLLETSPALASVLADNDPVAFDSALLTTLAPARVGGAIAVNGPISTGNFLAGASGAVGIGALDASTRILIDSGAAITTGDITTPATLSLTSSSLISTGAISAADVALASSGAGVTTGSVSSGDSFVVTAAGPITVGAVATGLASQRQGRGRVALDATGGIVAGAVNAPGDVTMIARTGNLTVNGAVASGGNVALLADTGIATQALGGSADPAAFVFLGSTANAARINADGTFPAGFAGNISVSATPIAVSGPISGGIVRTGGGASSYGAITATGSANLFGLTLNLSGAVAAPMIQLLAGDIMIGQGASIGNGATQSVGLVALPVTSQAVTIGGAAQGPGYTLDAAEFGRIRAQNITFSTGSASTQQQPAMLVVHDLVLNGAGSTTTQGNLTGAQGAITLTSAGSILVDGNVRLQNAAAGNALVFSAGNGFSLVTDTGSIGVFGAGNALAGRLAITGDNIAVGTAALLAQADDFEAGDEAAGIALIGRPTGTRPEGYVQAGRLELTGTDYIVIQNSGTATTAGGFTSGSGGMSVSSRSASDGGPTGDGLALVIYGRTTGDNGAFLTNDATRSGISFSSNTEEQDPFVGFATFSVVNGCTLLATTCGGGEVSEPAMQSVMISTDVASIIDGPLAADNSSSEQAVVPDVRLTTVIDAAPLITDPLVEEPVTGGGNPSLWFGGGDGTVSGASDTGATGTATGAGTPIRNRGKSDERKRRGKIGGGAGR